VLVVKGERWRVHGVALTGGMWWTDGSVYVRVVDGHICEALSGSSRWAAG
jgi:hypothetical protein